MSDGENGNVVNLQLSQNGQMGKLEAKMAPKIKMRGKGKRSMKVFQVTRTILQVRGI